MRFITNLMDIFTQYLAYSRTVSELSSLTDRELRDIGISRYDIARIAAQIGT